MGAREHQAELARAAQRQRVAAEAGPDRRRRQVALGARLVAAGLAFARLPERRAKMGSTSPEGGEFSR